MGYLFIKVAVADGRCLLLHDVGFFWEFPGGMGCETNL